MKKMLFWLVLALCLAGCGSGEVFETLADEMVQPVMAQPREVSVELPEEAVLPAMETEGGTLYICKDYDVTLQTLEGGDLEKTVREVSGFDPEDLTIIETSADDADSFEFVWTSAGEWDDRICRCRILDDGSYHYVLTAMVDAELVGEYQEIWNGMFESFRLI